MYLIDPLLWIIINPVSGIENSSVVSKLKSKYLYAKTWIKISLRNPLHWIIAIPVSFSDHPSVVVELNPKYLCALQWIKMSSRFIEEVITPHVNGGECQQDIMFIGICVEDNR